MNLSKSELIHEYVKRCRELLDGKKGKDITVISLENKTVLSDYFIIASGSSVPQVKAMADAVAEGLKKDFSLLPSHIEGYEEGRWVLLDYLDFVVHIFNEEERNFYRLDKLWQSGSGRNHQAKDD